MADIEAEKLQRLQYSEYHTKSILVNIHFLTGRFVQHFIIIKSHIEAGRAYSLKLLFKSN